MEASIPTEVSLSRGLAEEYRLGAGYLIRWNFYEFDDSGRYFHKGAVDSLDLSGSEAILDIGCGRGEVLADIAKRKEHSGLLAGLDRSDRLQYAQNRDVCQYVCASADTNEADGKTHLPFTDDSFDISLAYFMLYHTSCPEDTVDELIRVTKEDGAVSVATSGANNKPLHGYFKDKIIKELGLYKIPSYVRPFNSAYAGGILRRKFNSVVEDNYDGFVTFKPEDFEENPKDLTVKIGAFVNSLRTINTHFDPQYTPLIDEIIRDVVIPEMKQKVSEQGELQELIHRASYTCSEPK